MNERGKYIVIEGNDGTGKSTQVGRLAEYFRNQNREVCIVEEPGSENLENSTLFANYLRDVIKNGKLKRAPEINLALFSAVRRELWREKIAPALGRGAIVLAARNYLSTLAYQGSGEGLSADDIIAATELSTSEEYLHPDVTIILALGDEALRTQRIKKRGKLENPDTFESRGDDFQARVNAGYRKIAEEHALPIVECLGQDGHRKTVEEIHTEIIKLIENSRTD